MDQSRSGLGGESNGEGCRRVSGTFGGAKIPVGVRRPEILSNVSSNKFGDVFGKAAAISVVALLISGDRPAPGRVVGKKKLGVPDRNNGDCGCTENCGSKFCGVRSGIGNDGAVMSFLGDVDEGKDRKGRAKAALGDSGLCSC